MSTPAPEVREIRQHPRFVVEPIVATFGTATVRVMNVSGGGLQIDHADPVKIGASGLMKIVSKALEEETTFRATVVWSRLSKTPSETGKLLYRSGLILADPPASTYGFLGRLIRTLGKPDRDSLERKRAAILEREKSRGRVPELRAAQQPKCTSDQLLAIQQARARLALNFGDTQRLYDLAKSSLASRQLPVMHKPEVLAVWKYLGETVEPDLIATVIELAK